MSKRDESPEATADKFMQRVANNLDARAYRGDVEALIRAERRRAVRLVERYLGRQAGVTSLTKAILATRPRKGKK